MQLSTQEQIKSLQNAIKKDDSEQIFDLASSLLTLNPDDSEYQQCLAIAAIRLDRHDHLLKTIFKEMPKTGGQLDKLYAYFLYSSGQFEKCLEVISKLKQQLSTKLLLSQVYFKLMDYNKSKQLMSQIIKEEKIDKQEKETYLVNLFATGEHSPQTETLIQNTSHLITKDVCRELYYNYALTCFEMNGFQDAEKYLKMFEASLGKDDELDKITVKLLRDYMKMKLKKDDLETDMMSQEYEKMLQENKDKNIRGVLSNNLLFLKGHEEGLSDTAKQIDQMFNPSYKMSKIQKILLKINKMSLLLRKNRFTQSFRIMKEIEEIIYFKALVFNFEFVCNKYFLLKKMKEEKAIHELMNDLTNTRQHQLKFCLLTDYHQEQNNQEMFKNLNQALKWDNIVIQNYIFSQLLKNPTFFQENSAKLDELIEKTKDMKILQIVLKIYESKNDQKKQEFVLRKILSINPKNMFAKIKMAKICLAAGNIAEVEELLRGAQTPQQITDLTYLQSIEKNIHISVKKEETIHEEQKKDTHKKRIKKKKKPRLPKNIEKFIEGYKGDPERWLPKWQRKGYKRRGKKGGKTQGLAVVGKEEKSSFGQASTSTKEVTKQQQKKRR